MPSAVDTNQIKKEIMAELIERLIKLDNLKLTDDVKNYKQYGYDDSIRKTALEILKTKGFEEDDLKFTGNDINYKYERAIEISRVYKRNYGTVFFYIYSSGFFYSCYRTFCLIWSVEK